MKHLRPLLLLSLLLLLLATSCTPRYYPHKRPQYRAKYA